MGRAADLANLAKRADLAKFSKAVNRFGRPDSEAAGSPRKLPDPGGSCQKH